MEFNKRDREKIDKVQELKTAVYEKEKIERFLKSKVKENKALKKEAYFDELEFDDPYFKDPRTKQNQELAVVKEKSIDEVTEKFIQNPESDELSEEFLSQLDSEDLVQYFMQNIDKQKLAEDFYSQVDDFKMPDNIKNVSYYDKYEIDGSVLENVYVVTKNEVVDGKVKEVTELYMKNEDFMVAQINDDGSVQVDEKVAALINQDELSKENILENKQNLKANVRQIGPKEMQQILIASQENDKLRSKDENLNKDKKDVKDLDGKKDKEKGQEDKDKVDSKEEASKDEEKLEGKDKEKKIEKDLVKRGFPKDLGLMNYKKIIDSRMAREFPEAVEGTEEVGVAYSTKLNAFICISKTKEGYMQTKGIGLSRPTMHSVMSIDEDGNEVEKRVPNATMGTNKKNKEFSVTIDQYGYYEVERVDRLPGNQRVANKFEGQGERERVTKDVKDTTDLTKHSRAEMEDYVDNYNENAAMGDKEQTTDDIKREKDFVFINSYGEEVSLADVARKNHMSFEELYDYFEKADGRDAEEKLENALDRINDEYTHGHMIRERTNNQENIDEE